MMKQNYNNKTKHRSAWFALVLLMITALPITAQNVHDRFQVDGYYYEVVDATAKTVKVTWANQKATTEEARQQVLANETADLPNEWKAYNGTPTQGKEDELKPNSRTQGETNQIDVIKIPENVSYKGNNWTVVAIGSYAFINERGITKVNLPESIEAIEDGAFYQSSVTRINFPTNLKYIGWRAFYKTNLDPYEVAPEFNNKKFRRNKKSSIPIKILGETAIGPQAFEGSFSKSEFECPNITFVGYQAFKGDKFKITTPIPATAKIGEATTDSKITDMYNNLPAGTDQRSGVESFAEYSYDLSSYTDFRKTTASLTVAEGPKTIPAGMFENAFINKDLFFIPLSVTTIEERAFANTGILSFNDLSKIKKIGARAFENGVMSGDFVIREQVEEVGDGAFAGNTQLDAFILKGAANCKIGNGVLEGCTNLEFLDLRNVNNTEFKNNLRNLSRALNSGTITAGLPTHTLVFLPDAPGITIAAGQDVNFVKGDGTCTKLSLQDGMEYEFPYAFTAKEAVYNRCDMIINNKTIPRGSNTALTVAHYEGDNSLTSYRDFSAFANGKNCFTIFLPYAVTLPDGIRAYNLNLQTKRDTDRKNPISGKPIQEEVYMFKSIPDGSTLEANRPYLLRITDGGNSHSSQQFNAVDNLVKIAASGNDKYPKSGRLKPSGFVPATSDQSFCFYGSTERSPRYWNENENSSTMNPYTLGHDKADGSDVWKRLGEKDPGQSKLLPPFRGFIMGKLGTTAAKEFVLLTENETTGINDVTTDTNAQQGAQRIYTMDGRYVGTDFDSLPSGMYIMKGKKTLKTK